jgi:hypothetical protein
VNRRLVQEVLAVKMGIRARVQINPARDQPLPGVRARWERAGLGDEPPKSRDRLRDSGIGHVGQWDRLAVEYAGWVRIVGT